MGSRTLNLAGLSKIKLDKDLLESSFDRISRYYISARIINALSPENKPTILDVGGLGSILPRILSTSINIFDTDPNEDPNYIQGDATQMTLKDNSFDVVVTCDTLEHIPEAKRADFIQELVRVSKDLVIMCAPFDSGETAASEVAMNEFYKKLNGKPHRWLQEHIEAGLPKEKNMEKVLDNLNVDYIKVGHTDIHVWRSLVELNFLAECIEHAGLRKCIGDLNTYYNKELVDDDFSNEQYRLFYVISKTGPLSLVKGKSFGKGLARQALLEQAQATYKDGLALVGKDAVVQTRKLTEAQQKIAGLEAVVKPLQIAERKLSEEIYNIKTSKGWRMLEKAHRVKAKLPSSRRR